MLKVYPIGELKPKHEWDKTDKEGNEDNCRALFSIFNGVCPNEFCWITNYKCVKEAWDIPQVTHKAMFALKISKLQMLATRFKNIRMHENQNFIPFILN